MILAVIFMVFLQFAIVSFPTDVRRVDAFDQSIIFIWRLVLVVKILSSIVFTAFALMFVIIFNVYFCFRLNIKNVINLHIKARAFNFDRDWFLFWFLSHFHRFFIYTDVFPCCIWVFYGWSFCSFCLSMRNWSSSFISTSVEANCFMLFHSISFSGNRWNGLDESYHCFATIWIKASIITSWHFYIS